MSPSRPSFRIGCHSSLIHSGAEGTLIESDNRVSNVIWGLDNAQARVASQPRPDDSPLTEESPALSEFSPEPGADPLLYAALRLAQQMDGMSMAPTGTPLLSPIGSESLYLAGLGLDFKARHREAESVATGMRPTGLNSYGQARDSRRVVSAGSLTVAPGDCLKPPPTNRQIPTPPSSHWTPRFPGVLSVADPSGYSCSLRRDSPQLPTSDRYPRAREWQARPNSSVAQPSPREYPVESDTNPRFDFYDYSSQEHTHAAHRTHQGHSHREAGGRMERQEDTIRSGNVMGLVDHVTTQRESPAHSIHCRLPVLEEDSSFAAFPRYSTAHSSRAQSFNTAEARQRSAATSRTNINDLYEKSSGKTGSTRSAVGSSTHRATPAPGIRTVKTTTYTAPHRRAKEKKEA